VVLPSEARWRRFSGTSSSSPTKHRSLARRAVAGLSSRLRHGKCDALPRRVIAPGPFDVQQLCRQFGVPCHAVDDANDDASLALLNHLRPDVLLSAGYIQILSPAVLSVPRKIAVNFHPSSLPYYRGRHPHYWALWHGEQSTGVTAHRMGPRIDAGSILHHEQIAISPNDYYEDLYTKINAAVPLAVDGVDRFLLSGETPRADLSDGEGSYFSEPTAEHRTLDWSRLDARSARNRVRSGGAFFQLGRKRVSVLSAEVATNDSPRGRPGEVLACDEAIDVETAQGVLRLTELNIEGAVYASRDVASQLRIRPQMVLA
ncbi:MAG: hypothetical protein KDA61_17055, partial [Planctomycetales bacterium]|nr:hypothetical protein [Planctomycetales bacterium]